MQSSLDRLAADGVEMVAFDVDFSARSDKAGDKAFADALKRMQPVILPIFQQKASDDPSERQLVRNCPAAGICVSVDRRCEHPAGPRWCRSGFPRSDDDQRASSACNGGIVVGE